MEAETVTYAKIQDVPDTVWKKLSRKKIYFGHQSVGFNLMDGVEDLMKEHPQISLSIVETHDSKDLKSGVLAHSRVGQNRDPQSKIEEFTSFIKQGLGRKADAAALKFCYVDMVSDTNAEDVFQAYAKEVSTLREAYPDLTIIHFTVPLTKRQTGWKAMVKKMIGREVGGIAENMKRMEYNQLLIDAYQGKEPVFDIAKIESTHTDGTRSSFKQDGKTVYTLAPEYTHDGGHLNDLGRLKVAEQFLLLLASLV